VNQNNVGTGMTKPLLHRIHRQAIGNQVCRASLSQSPPRDVRQPRLACLGLGLPGSTSSCRSGASGFSLGKIQSESAAFCSFLPYWLAATHHLLPCNLVPRKISALSHGSIGTQRERALAPVYSLGRRYRHPDRWDLSTRVPLLAPAVCSILSGVGNDCPRSAWEYRDEK
jgi:hypothetical protein